MSIAATERARQQILPLTHLRLFRHPSYPQYVSGFDLAACAFLNLAGSLDRSNPVAAQNLRHIGLRQAKMLGKFALRKLVLDAVCFEFHASIIAQSGAVCNIFLVSDAD